MPCFNASDAENLAKYVIHAVLQRLEGCEPRKICDSRKVAMLQIAQNREKYMIHAVFQWFEALKI